MPETFSAILAHSPENGVWRPAAELRNAAIGGLFCNRLRLSRGQRDCLAGGAMLIAPVSTPIPLRKLTGKIFQRTGNLFVRTGITVVSNMRSAANASVY